MNNEYQSTKKEAYEVIEKLVCGFLCFEGKDASLDSVIGAFDPFLLSLFWHTVILLI